MDKEKAKAAFEKWWASFPINRLGEFIEPVEAYLAGAEWAWGEVLKDKKLRTITNFMAQQKELEKLQAENERLKVQLEEDNEALDNEIAENAKLRECVEGAVKYLMVTYPYRGMCPTEYEPEHEMFISFEKCLKEIEGE